MGKDYHCGEEIDLSEKNIPFTKETKLIGHDKLVLDIGCHDGAVAGILTQQRCTIVGIEMDQEAARAAEKVCEHVVVGDVETLDLVTEFGGYSFDVVLFGDVLEHLKNPAWILEEARRLLKPGGFIVVSVPNITHVSIRMMMLFGEFEYAEYGILDDTHLQYFTKESIVDLLESSGFAIESIDPVRHRLPDNQLGRIMDPLGISTLESVRRSLSEWESVAYQYVIRAFPVHDQQQVLRLCTEKTSTDRLVEEMSRRSKDMAEQIEMYRSREKEYQEVIERKKKELGNAQLRINACESTVAARDERLASMNNRLQELENAIQKRFYNRLRHKMKRLLSRGSGSSGVEGE